MQEVPRATANSKENCRRCLQPLTGNVARCPGCGQPVQASARGLRLAIGFAGLLALIFAVVVMYQTVRDEDAAAAPAPVEEVQKTPGQELFPDPPPDNGNKEAPKPEKKPPLNEK